MFKKLFSSFKDYKACVPEASSSAPVNVPASSSPSGSRSKSSLSLDARQAEKLLPGYLADAVRDSTKRVYSSYWKRYLSFCQQSQLNIFKAKSISLFLISLAESKTSSTAPALAKSALKYHLKLRAPFRKCAVNSYFISRISRTISRKFAKPVSKAKPLTSSIVKTLVVNLLSSGSFKDFRTAAFILAQFVLFARYEEVSKLKRGNVRQLPSGDLEFKFEEAKNYSVSSAQCSLVAKNHVGEFDPAAILAKYWKTVSSGDWLFPNFSLGKGGKIIFKDTPVSYQNMLKLMRSALSQIGFNGDEFSLHSPRTGSLSEAARKGVQKEILARHGRWSNVEMVNLYHQMSIEERLSAPMALDIYS